MVFWTARFQRAMKSERQDARGQKTIETARLRLRPRTLDDLEAIVAMDRDEEVRRFIGGPLETEPIAPK